MSTPVSSNEPAPLIISISGLRGLVGKTLTPLEACRYGAAVGSWARQTSGESQPLILIGRDSRPSGRYLSLAATAGLLSVGCRVIDLGLVTTPGAAIMTVHRHAAAGIVVTASHNPMPWNGLKTLGSDGLALPPSQAQTIAELFRKANFVYTDPQTIPTLQSDPDTAQVHVRRILENIDVAAIRQRRFKVVLDSVHGAGGPSTAMLLQELGVQLIHLGAEPTGLFPHPPEPTRENLTQLGQAVSEHRADLGLAQDPDADRLALIDEQGRYIGEEYTLALCALHLLETRLSPTSQRPILVANLSTSRMIDDIAARFGATVLRTPVGEAHVAQVMRQHQALIGGEGNGGVIWPVVGYVRDSLTASALILEMLARHRKPLSALVAQLPCYAMIKEKLPLDPQLIAQFHHRLAERFADQKLDFQDGLRIDWPDRWVHIRPSNTEPIIRLVAEAPDSDSAAQLIQTVRSALNRV